ncbi:MAG TPA: N-acetylneuraminate synthase family protein [Candidatus Wunengus sp. YC60]|uniref:N-acetylneuraminate synthase family protein n=1 Tax=Candidatus Wunengus sp. YC60 TaxID=3367697 RepID=UPI004024E4CC
MLRTVEIGGVKIGDGYPVYIVAEIGINHNGDINIAKKLIDLAVIAGFNAVKFQKRNPDVCVPTEQRNIKRETPWGVMTYLEYRHRIEFGKKEYEEINRYCAERGIAWFVSCWDKPSVDFIDQFDPICYKIASASLTDDSLLCHIKTTGRPIILSTGMSNMDEIRHAVEILNKSRLVLTHNTSTYPCPIEELNLKMIDTLKREFGCPVGYSGHEVGLQTTYAAVALGANLIERHVTLNRHMWGSDHSSSVESTGVIRLVRDIRIIEGSLGDGIKRVYESEKKVRQRLRL